MFVGNGLAVPGIGAACGLAAALALSRLMKSLLFEVSPADPLTYFAALVGLVLAAALASYFRRGEPLGCIRWKLCALSEW